MRASSHSIFNRTFGRLKSRRSSSGLIDLRTVFATLDFKVSTGVIKGILVKRNRRKTRRNTKDNSPIQFTVDLSSGSRLTEGDIIQVVEGIHIFTVEDFRKVMTQILATASTACTSSVVIVRSGQILSKTISFVRHVKNKIDDSSVLNVYRKRAQTDFSRRQPPRMESKSSSSDPYLGLSFKSVAASVKGVGVENVVPGSPASEAGFIHGDIVAAINGTSIASSKDVAPIWQSIQATDGMSFSVLRPEEDGTGASLLQLNLKVGTSARSNRSQVVESLAHDGAVPKKSTKSSKLWRSASKVFHKVRNRRRSATNTKELASRGGRAEPRLDNLGLDKREINQIQKQEQKLTHVLGLSLISLSEPIKGAYVARMTERGVAAQAGLLHGDLIQSCEGLPVLSVLGLCVIWLCDIERVGGPNIEHTKQLLTSWGDESTHLTQMRGRKGQVRLGILRSGKVLHKVVNLGVSSEEFSARSSRPERKNFSEIPRLQLQDSWVHFSRLHSKLGGDFERWNYENAGLDDEAKPETVGSELLDPQGSTHRPSEAELEHADESSSDEDLDPAAAANTELS